MTTTTHTNWTEYLLIKDSEMTTTKRYRYAEQYAWEMAFDGETDDEWAADFFDAWDEYFTKA